MKAKIRFYPEVIQRKNIQAHLKLVSVSSWEYLRVLEATVHWGLLETKLKVSISENRFSSCKYCKIMDPDISETWVFPMHSHLSHCYLISSKHLYKLNFIPLNSIGKNEKNTSKIRNIFTFSDFICQVLTFV